MPDVSLPRRPLVDCPYIGTALVSARAANFARARLKILKSAAGTSQLAGPLTLENTLPRFVLDLPTAGALVQVFLKHAFHREERQCSAP